MIAAVHAGCIGGGVDLVTAADIRYCTQDAFFQIKEVEIGNQNKKLILFVFFFLHLHLI